MLFDNIGAYYRLDVSYSVEIILTEFSLLKRAELTKDFGLLFGSKLDIYDVIGGGERSYGVNASTGMEYTPNEDVYLNLIYNYRFNELSEGYIIIILLIVIVLY